MQGSSGIQYTSAFVSPQVRVFNGPAIALFVLILAIGIVVTILADNPLYLLVSLVPALYVLFALKIARQWEKAVVLRLGKFRRLAGPGMFWIVPIVDTIPSWIDHRVMVTPFRAERTTPWGVTVQSVEIRDIIIPADLENAMSRQAQAERERQARVILGESERQIADSFIAAAERYEGHPMAMHLRAMNMLFEGLKERRAMIIVPSTAVETMNLGAISGLSALSEQPMGPGSPRTKGDEEQRPAA